MSLICECVHRRKTTCNWEKSARKAEGNSEVRRNQKKKKPIRLLCDVVAFFVLFRYFLWPFYSKDGVCKDWSDWQVSLKCACSENTPHKQLWLCFSWHLLKLKTKYITGQLQGKNKVVGVHCPNHLFASFFELWSNWKLHLPRKPLFRVEPLSERYNGKKAYKSAKHYNNGSYSRKYKH